ncbi:MAG: D-glycerate dehydrogenase [bacterium]|nr:D-glycerate dehydrogenase [bacterium]
MIVLVTRRLPAPALEKISAALTLDLWDSDDPPEQAVLMDRVRGKAGILCTISDRIDAALMDAAGGSLKVISQMAVGYDNIDIHAAAARGIVVGNTPGVLTEATADLALALLLAAARRLPEGSATIRAGRWTTWRPMEQLGRDLHGATLGIIGFGRIGQAVARRAHGFGLHILAYSPSLTAEDARQHGAERADLTDLLRRSDFVSLHTPLNADTRHLIDAAALAHMKPDAILINTARGAVVDQEALTEALQNGRIGGAALDVTDPEPMRPDDPLLSLPNVLIVPHVGSATHHTRTRMALMAADNLIAGVRGEPLPNPVRVS